jgi:catechol 2,3-dioxygenase-like lactoylglutathione lyase family enzyme
MSDLHEDQAMLHHVSLAGQDLDRSASFYDAALGALGFVRVWSDATAVGYGRAGGGDQLAIKAAEQVPAPSALFHVAFAAPSRDAVHAFHRAGLEHGGVDNGPPGLRPEYGLDYYAAFLIDPDGHNIEAVIVGEPAGQA